MKKKGRLYSIVLILAFFTFGVLPAQAVTVGLFDWAFNVDGTVYESSFDELSDISGLDESGFTESTGLGTLKWISDVAGDLEDHSFIAFFDHEIDENINTYFNEYGTVHNKSVLPVGQSWEIDEPGYKFGDIYQNTTGWDGVDYSSPIGLDNYNNVDSSWPDDVSMAMGWDFGLGEGEYATISLVVSDDISDMPTSGFYLSQTDPDSEYSIYFSTALEITGNSPAPGPGPSIPEPSTLFLMGLGLAGLFGVQRRRASRKNV